MTNTTSSPKFDLYTLAVLLLALVSFFLSLTISRHTFNRLPHLEDELAYLYQAQVFARGDLVVESPVPARPLWKPFVVDYANGNRFSKYTPGWSAWLAVGVLVGEPWVINAFFGMLTVILIYKLGRVVFNPDVGLVAALLLTFAPIAMLLNATIMSHTSALFFATLFMYAYWRFSVPVLPMRKNLLWGAVAGFALGMMIVNRPLSAIAIAAPFVVWSIIRLGRALFKDRQQFLRTLYPLVLLGAIALILAAGIFIYNYAATGQVRLDLYTLWWDYDKVGFGEGYGKNTHTLEKGVAFARYDLSLLAADLFGWQLGTFNTEIQQGLLDVDSYHPLIGFSWILLLPGLVLGYKKFWSWLWGLNVVVWLWWLPSGIEQNLTAWLLVGAALLLSPLVFVTDDKDQQPVWTWLLMAVMVSLVTVHLAYWIGSQRYSTRYYYEMISAAVIISAVPVAWLIRKLPSPGLKLGGYGVMLAICLISVAVYSTPRIDALRGFNRITPAIIQEVNARRTTDKPVLVLVAGKDGILPSWRSYGTLMAITSPYLDSDIVAAAFEDDRPYLRDALIEAFPDREIIEMGGTNAAGGDHSWFIADCKPDGTCPVANQPRQW